MLPDPKQPSSIRDHNIDDIGHEDHLPLCCIHWCNILLLRSPYFLLYNTYERSQVPILATRLSGIILVKGRSPAAATRWPSSLEVESVETKQRLQSRDKIKVKVSFTFLEDFLTVKKVPYSICM